MGVHFNREQWKRVREKCKTFFQGFDEDLRLAGEAAAETIIRFTLAGIGENDEAFAPYSAAYQELIDAVGGKPQQTVTLRGIFYHASHNFKMPTDDKEIGKLMRKGALRQSFVRRQFNARTTNPGFNAAGATHQKVDFQAKTGITRPARGITDPLSEMSLDLIKVTATQNKLTLTYTPRNEDYMIRHQRGDAIMPKRKWFTFNRKGTSRAMLKVLQTRLKARASLFNDPNSPAGAKPPTTPPANPGAA